MSIAIGCPHCDHELDVEIEQDGGDWVPYGSTFVQTPSGVCCTIVGLDDDNACPNCKYVFPADEIQQLEERAIARAHDSLFPDDL